MAGYFDLVIANLDVLVSKNCKGNQTTYNFRKCLEI